MAARLSSSRIVGLSWQKIKSPVEGKTEQRIKKGKKEKEDGTSNTYENVTNRKAKATKFVSSKKAKAFGERVLKTISDAENMTSAAGASIQEKVLKQAASVKHAITSLKQKMKSTKRRKRLVAATPSPFKADLISSTPESVTRSGRLLRAREIKMYSPFGIDSPLSTRGPLKPRMGLGSRILLNSPDSLGELLADDMQAMANLSDDWSTPGTNRKLTRSKIRTTPRSLRRSLRSKKPLFQ